jgi:exonuclease III
MQTFNQKTRILERFMIRNNIDILATTETRHTDSKQIDAQFKEHVFLGNTYKSPVGGVGFVVRRELLDATEIDIQQGEYENSMFLTIGT